MRAITYTEARNNLASEPDCVGYDCDVTTTHQEAEAGVLMSLREYEWLTETFKIRQFDLLNVVKDKVEQGGGEDAHVA